MSLKTKPDSKQPLLHLEGKLNPELGKYKSIEIDRYGKGADKLLLFDLLIDGYVRYVCDQNNVHLFPISVKEMIASYYDDIYGRYAVELDEYIGSKKFR
eukprot:887520_1